MQKAYLFTCLYRPVFVKIKLSINNLFMFSEFCPTVYNKSAAKLYFMESSATAETLCSAHHCIANRG